MDGGDVFDTSPSFSTEPAKTSRDPLLGESKPRYLGEGALQMVAAELRRIESELYEVNQLLALTKNLHPHHCDLMVEQLVPRLGLISTDLRSLVEVGESALGRSD